MKKQGGHHRHATTPQSSRSDLPSTTRPRRHAHKASVVRAALLTRSNARSRSPDEGDGGRLRAAELVILDGRRQREVGEHHHLDHGTSQGGRQSWVASSGQGGSGSPLSQSSSIIMSADNVGCLGGKEAAARATGEEIRVERRDARTEGGHEAPLAPSARKGRRRPCLIATSIDLTLSQTLHSARPPFPFTRPPSHGMYCRLAVDRGASS